jgi:hypothetical protein
VFNVHEFLFTRESAEAQAFVDTVKAALVFHEIFRLEDVLISELEAFFDVLYTRFARTPSMLRSLLLSHRRTFQISAYAIVDVCL